MSNNIVTKSPIKINGQSSTSQTKRDQTVVLLAKLKALLELGINSNFEINTSANMYGYLCVLFDLVEQLGTVI
jgi:hypothetical protein